MTVTFWVTPISNGLLHESSIRIVHTMVTHKMTAVDFLFHYPSGLMSYN